VKKHKEMNEVDLKTRCMDLHIALSDGDSHVVNGVDPEREIIPEGTGGQI
jgi:hypothetical protein